MLKIEKLNQLDIPKGKCTCLMGRNGVGKTTLVQSVMGILPARSGQIVFDGKDLTKVSAEKRASLGIGYVPRSNGPRLYL